MMIKKKNIKIKIEQSFLKKDENYILLLKNKKDYSFNEKRISKRLFNKNSMSFFQKTKFSLSLSLSSYNKTAILTDYLLSHKKRFHEIVLLKWNKHLLTPQQGLLISSESLFVRFKNLTESHKKFCFLVKTSLST